MDHNAARARNSMSQAVGLIVQMDENLKEEEEILQQRANRLRRQSADAFKLMNDVSKVQQYVLKSFPYNIICVYLVMIIKLCKV